MRILPEDAASHNCMQEEGEIFLTLVENKSPILPQTIFLRRIFEP